MPVQVVRRTYKPGEGWSQEVVGTYDDRDHVAYEIRRGRIPAPTMKPDGSFTTNAVEDVPTPPRKRA